MPGLPETIMLSKNDLSCSICCYHYCRQKRLPRVLHCNHTFCCVCLEELSKLSNFIYTVSCPLCRWTTCTPSMLKLTHYLHIDTEIWDLITNETEALWVAKVSEEVTEVISPRPKKKVL